MNGTKVASKDVPESKKEVASFTIDDAPCEGQTVLHAGQTYTTIKEGLAYFLVPEAAKTSTDPKAKKGAQEDVQSVFYNPIQQFNRDLSVLAIRAYCEDLMALREQKAQAKASRGTKRKRKEPADGRSNQNSKPDAKSKATSSDMSMSGATSAIEQQSPSKKADLVSDDADANEPTQGKLIADVTTGDSPMDVDASSETQNQPRVSEHEQSRKPLAKIKPRFKILDALSATGLRALRYSQEIPQVTSVTANDLSKQATESIKANVKYNKLEDKIEVITGNAMSHMYSLLSSPAEFSKPPKYDVIDLDPYGTAAPFFDGAVQAVNDGGLLCITCTDSALLASCGYSEKTFSQYGGTPLKGLHSHEGGLRLILHAIGASAGRYGMSIEPLLSLSIDYYMRVFVRVFQSPAEVKLLAGKTMLVFNCDGGCGAWTTQPIIRNQIINTRNDQTVYRHSLAQGPTTGIFCEHCGSKTHVSGPMYAGPLHNASFIQSILSQLPTLDQKTYQTTERLEGMLTTALEEILLDDGAIGDSKSETNGEKNARLVPHDNPAKVDRNPFYFVPSALAKVLHARSPSEAEVRGALKYAGYGVTRSHARPGSIKTNAPWSFIWHMMREWMRQKAPIKEGAIKQGTPGYGIMHGVEVRQRWLDSKSTTNAHPEEPQADPVEESGDTNTAPTATPSSSAAGAQWLQEAQGEHHAKAVIFNEELGKEQNKRRLKRYQENPRANWGPMNRAKGPARASTKVS